MDIYSKLREIESSLVDHPERLEELSRMMKSKETQEEIEKFLNADSVLTDDAVQLKTLIDCAQSIYNYSGKETGISDPDYDVLYEKLVYTNPDTGITVAVVTKADTVYHRYPSLRGTLDKIYALTDDDVVENKSRRTLDDWIKSSENKIYEKTGQRISLADVEIYCFPKFDGVSGIFEFSKDGKLLRVLTRGFTETNEAQDITHIFKDWVTGPYTDCKHEYGLKTEIMMSDEDFNRYNEEYGTDYKQSRSIVSSIINSDECDDRVKYLQLMHLRTAYLNENGEESLQELAPGAFNTPYLRCRLSDREAMRKFAFEHKYINGMRCDGMVIYIIDEKIQKILGRENNKQKFEVAFKFTEESGYTKLKDIKFTTGLFGRINPVAVIKPIKLKGNTIENISLGSMGRFKELKLRKGDRVKVLYDIIPYLVFDESDEECKRSNNEVIEAPDRCYDCGAPLVSSDSGDLLYCENAKCPCKEKGKILNYMNKMHIDGISYATVDTFYEEGYLKSIKDLYKLNKHKKKLEDIPGFGKKSIDIILDEIDNHLNVPASQMLGSLGIEGMSTKMFEKVLSVLSFDELMEYCLDDQTTRTMNLLSVIPGIKEKSALKIINGIRDNEKLIEFLEDVLTIIPEKNNASSKFSVVFTKVRSEEIEKWIADNGGVVKDSLSKDVDLLVVPMLGVESSKVTKANKYGIPVVPIDKAQEYISEKLL